MPGVFRTMIASVALILAVAACGEDAAPIELSCAAGVDCTFVHQNVQVMIPAAAIPNGLRLTASPVQDPPDSLTILPGTTWDLGPDGTTFTPPATVVITLPSGALDELDGVRMSEVAIYRRTDENDAWTRVAEQVANIDQGRFAATLSSLSIYTLMGAPAYSIELTAPVQHTIAVGASVQLDAVVRAEDGTVLPDRPVEWESQDESIATVSANGLVVGVAAGTTTVTARAGTAQNSRTIVVEGTTGPPPPSTEPVPGAGDVVVYDDDMSGFATMAERHARRQQLLNGTAPFYFFDGPTAANQREALDSIVSPGFNGSPFAYRIRVPAELNNFYQASMYGEIIHRSPIAPAHFNPPGTTLVVDLWVRINYPGQNLLWIKGLELFHNFDRTQYGVYLSSATLGWANIHPQSNNREIYMHLENGAADAPTRYRRWGDVSNGQWIKLTHVYKASSGTGVARDGINRMYVDGEKIIDASLSGYNTGWMVDRRNGVSASSTNPYPGNVGDKYTNVTGDQALLGLADDPVIQIIWPGIISTSASGGGGTIDLGRVRIWYRP